VKWQEELDAAPSAQVFELSLFCFRGRILKQIIAMMLSASSPATGLIADSHLRRYVTNAEVTGIPAQCWVYAALTRSKTQRQMGGQGIFRADGSSTVLVEVTFAPLITIMTSEGSTSPEPRLVDISFMAASPYKSRETISLRLPVLEPNSFYPGAFLPSGT
jgi:hypothetical protein